MTAINNHAHPAQVGKAIGRCANTGIFFFYGEGVPAHPAPEYLSKLMNPLTIEQIATVCHEANRAYCETLGDTTQPSWDLAPDWQVDSAKKGVEFHLENLENGEKASPSASHDYWLAQKTVEGWKYGPVKDAEKKEHPCFLPYAQLPVEQRLKDYIFAAIVEAFWKARTLEMGTTA